MSIIKLGCPRKWQHFSANCSKSMCCKNCATNYAVKLHLGYETRCKEGLQVKLHQSLTRAISLYDIDYSTKKKSKHYQIKTKDKWWLLSARNVCNSSLSVCMSFALCPLVMQLTGPGNEPISLCIAWGLIAWLLRVDLSCCEDNVEPMHTPIVWDQEGQTVHTIQPSSLLNSLHLIKSRANMHHCTVPTKWM